MDYIEPKKLILLRLYEVLYEFTDENHKLHKSDLVRILKIEYGIDCERKAIARNIEFLQQAGYDVVTEKTGVYLATKRFSSEELQLLIHAVQADKKIGKERSISLLDKLFRQGGKYFKPYALRLIRLDDDKHDEDLHYPQMELLYEAIDHKRRVRFTWQEESHTADVYELYVKNDKCYVAVRLDDSKEILFVPLAEMSALESTKNRMKPLHTLKGYEKGISLDLVRKKV